MKYCHKCDSCFCECSEEKKLFGDYGFTEPINLIPNTVKPIDLNDLTPKPIRSIMPEIPTFKVPKEDVWPDPYFSKPKMFNPRPMFRPMGMPQPQWNMMPTPPGFLKF